MKTLRLTKGLTMVVSHVVKPEQLQEWNNYTQTNAAWMKENLEVLQGDKDWSGLFSVGTPATCDL